jgi:hypothetical protein
VVSLGVGHPQAKQALHVARVPRQVEIHQRLFEGDKTTEGDVDAVSTHVEVGVESSIMQRARMKKERGANERKSTTWVRHVHGASSSKRPPVGIFLTSGPLLRRCQ